MGMRLNVTILTHFSKIFSAIFFVKKSQNISLKVFYSMFLFKYSATNIPELA